MLFLLVLELEPVHQTTCWCLKTAEYVTNSVDPNQAPYSADLVYTACPNIYCKYGISSQIFEQLQ